MTFALTESLTVRVDHCGHLLLTRTDPVIRVFPPIWIIEKQLVSIADVIDHVCECGRDYYGRNGLSLQLETKCMLNA